MPRYRIYITDQTHGLVTKVLEAANPDEAISKERDGITQDMVEDLQKRGYVMDEDNLRRVKEAVDELFKCVRCVKV